MRSKAQSLLLLIATIVSRSVGADQMPRRSQETNKVTIPMNEHKKRNMLRLVSYMFIHIFPDIAN